jgi:hypothetical protein
VIFFGKIKRKRSSYICIPSSFRAREENVAISPDLQLNRQCIQNFLEYICIYNQVKTYFSVGELNNFVTRNLKYCLRLGLHYTRGAKKHLSDTECTTFRSWAKQHYSVAIIPLKIAFLNGTDKCFFTVATESYPIQFKRRALSLTRPDRSERSNCWMKHKTLALWTYLTGKFR